MNISSTNVIFLSIAFCISLSYLSIAQGQSGRQLDIIISEEMNREIEEISPNDNSLNSLPVYQGNEQIVNGVPISPIHGQCGMHPNTCIKGVVNNIRVDQGRKWSCQGQHGGSTDFCHIKESSNERRIRQQIQLTEKINQEVSDQIENERLKVLEKHGQKTIDRLKGKDIKRSSKLYGSVGQSPSLTTVNKVSAPIKKADEEMEFYVSGGGGVTVFSEAENIRNGMNANVSIGVKFPKNWLFEVGFIYSDFKLDNYFYHPASSLQRDIDCSICRVREYAGVLNVRYHLFAQTLRPFIGFSGLYRYRDYQEDNYQRYHLYSSSSHGMDMGVNTGIDFAFNQKIIVGAEFRYMINLTNSISNNPYNGYYRFSYERSSDDFSYFTFGLNAKFFL